VIADVSGKGVTAGLLMAGLQASFRIFTKNDPTPASLMMQLNVALKENLPQSKFVTLFLGRLDTATGVVEYANAGHCPPLWLKRDGVEELGDTDLVLGVVPRVGYTSHQLQLDPGDALVIFPDGRSEAVNPEGEDLASQKLQVTLATLHGASADALSKAIEETVESNVPETLLADDVTLVVVSRN